jgi:hypothetical protein
MKRIFLIPILCIILFSCTQTSTNTSSDKVKQDSAIVNPAVATSSQTDSVSLLQFTKRLYEWNQRHNNDDYFSPFQYAKSDTIYARLNMEWHKQKLNELKRSALFTEKFIANYDKIAVTINAKMKDGTLEWKVGELPPFGNGSNPWCNCQDVPDDFLSKLYITHLKVENDGVSYNWSWGDGQEYSIKAIKENNEWKVVKMEGFDYDSFVSTFQNQNDFKGKWANQMVTLNIGETSLAFEYHGQCVYFYPVKKLSATEFEMIWARDMDCKFDNGTKESFGLKKVPQLGKPFAKFTLKNNALYAEYYYTEWIKKYTEKVQDGVFTTQYIKKNEEY